MAYFPGLTPPRPQMVPAVRNTLPRVPQIKPVRPVSPMGRSDIASGPGAQGGVGYGNVTSSAITPWEATNALPDVVNAKLDQLNAGAQATNNFNTQLGGLLSIFGDPTVLPGASGKSLAETFGLTGAGAQALASLDPAYLDLARANTYNQSTGTFGNSIVAQLYLAGQQAKQAAIDQAVAGNVGPSSQIGYLANQATMKYGNDLFNAIYNKFLTPATGYINDWQTTQQQLADAVTKAITTGTATVLANPTAYNVNTTTAPVGTVVQRPYGVGQGTNAPRRTSPAAFPTYSIGGPSYTVRGSHGSAPY